MSPTREQVLGMPAGGELDLLVAERLMGWSYHGDFDKVPDVPPCSTDPAAAVLLEDEIGRRGLMGKYVRALLAVIGSGAEESGLRNFWRVDAIDLWEPLRATPEQKARAALLAVIDPRDED